MSKRSLNESASQRMMHLLIDATGAGGRLTGLERYTREVTGSLWDLAQDRGVRITVAVTRSAAWVDRLKPFSGGEILRSPFESRLLTDHIWIPSQVIRFSPSHLFFPSFPPSPFAFITKAHIMRTIHDAVPWDYPETLSWKGWAYFRSLENIGLPRYRTIFTVSNRSKGALDRLFPALSERIINAGNGLSNFWNANSGEGEIKRIRKEYGITGPFLLSVGTLEPRKNFPFLIRAFAQALPVIPNVKLVLVGRKGWGADEVFEEVQRKKIADSFIWLENVGDDALRDLYRIASLFLYPSLNEGFGLPLLEAMSCGLPILASPESAGFEVVGMAATLCSLRDSQLWAEKIVDLLQNPMAREALSEEGIRQSRKFHWPTVAERIWTRMMEEF